VYKQGRAYDVPTVVLDISKACEEFDWKPQIDLLQGVSRTSKWMNTL